MAKQFVTDKGVVKIPGAYPSFKIQTSPGGLAANGVLMLIGEAAGGAHWSQEEDLESSVVFGPDAESEVSAKFLSGPLVDAFRGAIAASSDPDISGSFTSCVLIKTNEGSKASAALTLLGPGGAYTTLKDRNYGALGNQIQVAVASAVAEVLPTTGTFTYIPVVGTAAINCNLSFRANGGASVPLVVPQNQTPAAFVAAVAALAGVIATGGVNRGIITAGTPVVTVAPTTGNSATFTLGSGTWTTTPTAGDTLVVAAGTTIAGAANRNVGAYVITAANSTVITATKLSAAGLAGETPLSALLAPEADSGATAAADLVAYSPVTISLEAGSVLAGAGKALEVANTDSVASSTVQLASAMLFTLGTTTAATWISTSASPKLLTSAAESEMTLSAARSVDSLSETFTEGGEIALKIGHTGATVTLTISATQLTSSNGLTVNLADYSTLQAMADFISTQAGFTASPGNATLGLLPPSALDRVSAIGISSEFGTVQPGRVKIDAHRMFTAVDSGSRLVQFDDPSVRPARGLPAVLGTTFLSGGLRGATLSSDVTAALAALEDLDGNFVIPLFSRDASDDIADGLTDASSDYTVAGVHAAAKAHVLAMSAFKARRSRQALVSIEDAFDAQQEAASNLSHFRVACTFQNVKDLDSAGDIVAFQPWMAAVKAGSMQAAGFYRSITNKKVTISGLAHVAGDYNPKKDTHIEAALTAGLMPLRPSRTGGFAWVSDQTTYGADDNFAFNSLQAIYAADTIALSTGQRMEQAFVGQSVADINAQVALTYLDQIMADFLRLKLIAPSDGAKKGYKNAKIRISGNVMLVSIEIKLATAIDFVIIDFLVSPVQQTAQ